jgi:sugar phosphate isomerase/epimerase
MRLGGTSYVVEGDWLKNAEALLAIVSDMELVMWQTVDGHNNFPTPELCERLLEIFHQHHFTYSLHLPTDLTDADLESDALQLNLKAIQALQILMPAIPNVIFHIASPDFGTPKWYEKAYYALEWLLKQIPIEKLTLENLEAYPPQVLYPIFERFPIKRCLDVGHIWKQHLDPWDYLDSWLPETNVVHLHGVDLRMDDILQDHLSLTYMPDNTLQLLHQRLLEWRGLVTLEVFEQDFWTSLEVINKFNKG